MWKVLIWCHRLANILIGHRFSHSLFRLRKIEMIGNIFNMIAGNSLLVWKLALTLRSQRVSTIIPLVLIIHFRGNIYISSKKKNSIELKDTGCLPLCLKLFAKSGALLDCTFWGGQQNNKAVLLGRANTRLGLSLYTVCSWGKDSLWCHEEQMYKLCVFEKCDMQKLQLWMDHGIISMTGHRPRMLKHST